MLTSANVMMTTGVMWRTSNRVALLAVRPRAVVLIWGLMAAMTSKMLMT